MNRILIFTGHMIDKPGRPRPRFPITAEEAVRARLRAELQGTNWCIGFASGACGGDLLFHEAVQELGGESHVVLPCAVPEFREVCVDPFPGNWGDRFAQVLERAASVEILSEQCANDNSVASDCCNRVIYGLAALRARESGGRLTVLAFWDGRPGDAIGGTYSMILLCRERGANIQYLTPELPLTAGVDTAGIVPAGVSSAVRLPGAEQEPSQRIAAALFADVVRFSTISERQLPAFAEHYLGEVRRLLEKYAKDVLTRNTWGDGLYVAFDRMKAAGLFALDLSEAIEAVDWTALGFAGRLHTRIGLHAGPVYVIHDPVMDAPGYIGTHITRAARIEPTATEGGRPSCSRAFAALATAEGVTEFHCRLRGEIPLPKNAGTLPLYEVERT